MCLAIPMRIESIEGDAGMVNIGGVKRKVGLQFVREATVGDYVIVHAGFAIQKLDEQAALETLALFREMEDLG